jgi:hypothetical protein
VVKNVTISMSETSLARVRVEAAKAGLSVSHWIASELDRSLGRRDDKAAASARIDKLVAEFAGLPLSEDGKITIDRNEMYGRRG